MSELAIAPSLGVVPERDWTAASVWNERLETAGGHLLQSWEWGAFKQAHGWDVERLLVTDGDQAALAQVLFRQWGPISVAYVPRGPAVSASEPMLARQLFEALDDVCRQRRVIYAIVEPDQPLPFRGRFRDEQFVRGAAPFQPARTVKVPLGSDAELLAGMHQKTRYSVRLAERRGVRVLHVQPSEEHIDCFYRLLADTSERNVFGIHDRSYYADFLRHSGERALLLLAYTGDEVAAGLIAARFGTEAIYMYGGSSTVHRANGAAFALQFEAMRWARAAGCTRYDLWGIPLNDPDTVSDDRERIAGTHGSDWRGLYRFKIGFGGEVVTYPPTLERRYHPVLAFVARRFYAGRD